MNPNQILTSNRSTNAWFASAFARRFMLFIVLSGATMMALPIMSAAAEIHAAMDAGKQSCTSAPGFGDVLKTNCSWSSAETAQRLDFKATFGGSHDDTIVKIEPRLNGQVLACEDGSKTRADFEDGEVTLNCLFTTAAATGAQSLEVRIVWSHAQFMGYDFGPSR